MFVSHIFLVEKIKEVKCDIIWRADTIQYYSSGSTVINQSYQNFPWSKL